MDNESLFVLKHMVFSIHFYPLSCSGIYIDLIYNTFVYKNIVRILKLVYTIGDTMNIIYQYL